MKQENKTTMSVVEMGQILGLCKTEAYWLVHKKYFETTLVQGIMRVNIASFEHWYANQLKRRKVDGTPPGEELRSCSYSIQEIADLLSVSNDVIYTLVKRHRIETFQADSCMRVRKDIFEKWYQAQTMYRTQEDRERDAELEQASMTMPRMAKLLGITRDEVYSILGKKKNHGVFEIIVVAGKKRITYDSFERWYQNQDHYQKITERPSMLQAEPEMVDDEQRNALLCSDRTSFTVSEAALLIGVPKREIYRMIEDELLDSVSSGRKIRIRRSALSWWLSPQDKVFRKEES